MGVFGEYFAYGEYFSSPVPHMTLKFSWSRIYALDYRHHCVARSRTNKHFVEKFWDLSKVDQPIQLQNVKEHLLWLIRHMFTGALHWTNKSSRASRIHETWSNGFLVFRSTWASACLLHALRSGGRGRFVLGGCHGHGHSCGAAAVAAAVAGAAEVAAADCVRLCGCGKNVLDVLDFSDLSGCFGCSVNFFDLL